MMLRTLSVVAIALLAAIIIATFSGCATAQPTAAAYPAWLEMKEGYAESCIADGGCAPMSKREINEIVQIVHQRTMQQCMRNGT